MAIDTKSITQLISEFRKLQTKDSITPESLGYILQRLADLLARKYSEFFIRIATGWRRIG